MADAEKELGNNEFKVGNYEKAIVHFSKAIELGATHVLYSNRSACHCGLRNYDDALADVRAATSPDHFYASTCLHARRHDRSPMRSLLPAHAHRRPSALR